MLRHAIPRGKDQVVPMEYLAGEVNLPALTVLMEIIFGVLNDVLSKRKSTEFY